MKIKSVHLENFRAFQTLNVELQYAGRKKSADIRYPNLNVFLGINGAGKTSILQAIALGAAAPILLNSGFVPRHLVRRNLSVVNKLRRRDSGSAGVVAKLERDDLEGKSPSPGLWKADVFVEEFDEEGRLDIQTNPVAGGGAIKERMYSGTNPAMFLAAYGATRRVAPVKEGVAIQSGKMRNARYQRIAGIFEEHANLMPLDSWLPALKFESPSKFSEIVEVLNKLLPSECRVTDSIGSRRKFPEMQYQIGGRRLPFAALAEGYKGFIGWTSDLIYHLYVTSSSSRKIAQRSGVVLIDEVDLHLHPIWQSTILPSISKIFPNLQFVVTTHSPLVVGSVESHNLFIVEFSQDGASTARQIEETALGKSADEVLMTSYFNLESPRGGVAVSALKRLEGKAISGDRKAVFDYLRILTKGIENEKI